MKFIGIVLGAALSAMATAASADVVRHPIPNSTFPIAQAVTVTGNTTTVYVSGQVPPVVGMDATGHRTLPRYPEYDGPDARDRATAASARATRMPGTSA